MNSPCQPPRMWDITLDSTAKMRWGTRWSLPHTCKSQLKTEGNESAESVSILKKTVGFTAIDP